MAGEEMIKGRLVFEQVLGLIERHTKEYDSNRKILFFSGFLAKLLAVMVVILGKTETLAIIHFMENEIMVKNENDL